MKKRLVMLTGALLLIGALTACGKTDETVVTDPNAPTPTTSINVNDDGAITEDITFEVSAEEWNNIMGDSREWTAAEISANGQIGVPAEAPTYNFGSNVTTDSEQWINSSVIQGNGDWNDLTFYLFDTVTDAKNAFELIKDKMITSPIESSDRLIYGQDASVTNITMYSTWYRSGNLIITRTDYISDPGNVTAYMPDTNVEAAKTRRTEIMNRW